MTSRCVPYFWDTEYLRTCMSSWLTTGKCVQFASRSSISPITSSWYRLPSNPQEAISITDLFNETLKKTIYHWAKTPIPQKRSVAGAYAISDTSFLCIEHSWSLHLQAKTQIVTATLWTLTVSLLNQQNPANLHFFCLLRVTQQWKNGSSSKRHTHKRSSSIHNVIAFIRRQKVVK